MESTTTVDSREYCTAPSDRKHSKRRAASIRTAPAQPAGSQLAAAAVRPLKKAREYRKAFVGGLGAIAAVALSLSEPLRAVLGVGASQWIAVGVAGSTALATYFTKNAAPAHDATEAPPSTQVATSAAPQGVPPPPAEVPVRHTGAAIAGLALIVGGAVLAGRHSERHRRCVMPLTLLPSGGITVGR